MLFGGRSLSGELVLKLCCRFVVLLRWVWLIVDLLIVLVFL